MVCTESAAFKLFFLMRKNETKQLRGKMLFRLSYLIPEGVGTLVKFPLVPSSNKGLEKSTLPLGMASALCCRTSRNFKNFPPLQQI